MDWERVNVWTSTLYTLIHSLHMARESSFGELSTFDSRARAASAWIIPECSYDSVLLRHPSGEKKISFRRDPNKHFQEISRQVVKMLIQDLTVILDQMMDDALAQRGEVAGTFPQSKIEKLKKGLAPRYHWAAHGCLELVAVRNVLTHAGGRWNDKSIAVVGGFLNPLPVVGEKLEVGVPMLFRYRKAMRTMLNQVAP